MWALFRDSRSEIQFAEETPKESIPLFFVKLCAAVFTGVLAAISWYANGCSWTSFATGYLFAVSLATFMLRWGWIVPCTLVGPFVGFSFDSTVKGGSIESQVWETVLCIFGGVFAGILIGAALDFPPIRESRTEFQPSSSINPPNSN